MTEILCITDIVRDVPPVFRGQWMSKSVSIELDSSALMKLLGNDTFAIETVRGGNADDRITRAAQRLLEDGVFAEQAGGIAVTLTGLDID